jgi:hypothetical protein
MLQKPSIYAKLWGHFPGQIIQQAWDKCILEGIFNGERCGILINDINVWLKEWTLADEQEGEEMVEIRLHPSVAMPSRED